MALPVASQLVGCRVVGLYMTTSPTKLMNGSKMPTTSTAILGWYALPPGAGSKQNAACPDTGTRTRTPKHTLKTIPLVMALAPGAEVTSFLRY